MGRVTTTTLPAKNDNGAFKGFDETDQNTIREMHAEGKSILDIASVLSCEGDDVEQFIANEAKPRSRGRRRVTKVAEDAPDAPPENTATGGESKPKTRKQRKSKAKPTEVEPMSNVELAAVGTIVQEAATRGITPADLVEGMRFQVASWDKLPHKS
jgi:hypothetical protein